MAASRVLYISGSIGLSATPVATLRSRMSCGGLSPASRSFGWPATRRGGCSRRRARPSCPSLPGSRRRPAPRSGGGRLLAQHRQLRSQGLAGSVEAGGEGIRGGQRQLPVRRAGRRRELRGGDRARQAPRAEARRAVRVDLRLRRHGRDHVEPARAPIAYRINWLWSGGPRERPAGDLVLFIGEPDDIPDRRFGFCSRTGATTHAATTASSATPSPSTRPTTRTERRCGRRSATTSGPSSSARSAAWRSAPICSGSARRRIAPRAPTARCADGARLRAPARPGIDRRTARRRAARARAVRRALRRQRRGRRPGRWHDDARADRAPAAVPLLPARGALRAELVVANASPGTAPASG